MNLQRSIAGRSVRAANRAAVYLGAALAIVLQAASIGTAADVISTWDGTTNNWTSNHWANVPGVAFVPNNGNGGFTYDAKVSAGTVTLNQNIVINGLTLSGGGAITGSNNLNVLSGINWSGGKFSGNGQTTIAGGTIGSGTLDARTLRFTSNVTWGGGEILRSSPSAAHGTIVVENGATFKVEGSGDRNLAANLQVNSGGKFINAVSSAPSGIYLAHIVFDGPGGTLTNNGIVEAAPNTHLSIPGGSGNGSFVVGNNSVMIAMLNNNANEFQFTGNVLLDNGMFDVLVWNGGAVQFPLSASLTGTGAVNVNTLINSRSISPGNPLANNIGVLTVNGKYQQTSQGVLAIDIKGTSPSQVDKLSITGTAQLGGVLKIDTSQLAAVPASGTLFPIMTASSITGEFASVVSSGNNNIYFVTRTVASGGSTTEYAESKDRGNMNGDNLINSIDYDLFAYGLMNRSTSKYYAKCDCSILPEQGGDFNGNGRLDFDDISGFQSQLRGMGMSSAELMDTIETYLAAVPEPRSGVIALIGGLFASTVCRNRRWNERGARSAEQASLPSAADVPTP